jgi:hypothetical protein
MLRFFFTSLIFSLYATYAYAGIIEESGWLAFGDLRGYIEPCGCDPDADLGGIQRDAVFLQKERAVNGSLFLFNLGNNVPVNPDDEVHKTPVILAAIRDLKADAVLFNELERLSYLRMPAQFYGTPYVVSNLKVPAEFSQIKTHVKTRGIYVTGFVESETSKTSGAPFLAFSQKIVRQWKFEATGLNERVLLFNGSEATLAKIQALKFFQLIISSNQRLLTAVVGPEEKENEKLLNRLNGKVRMVPVGGQGFLRGGVLLQKKAQSLEQLLKGTACADGAKGILGRCGSGSLTSKTEMTGIEAVTWLTKAYALPSSLDKLYAEYQRASEKVFLSKAEQRKKDLSSSPFVGSEACKSCHSKEYKAWSESKHAHAMDVLVRVNKDRDPECVSCHVLGYSEKGGFVDQKSSPQFAHVNCENCHGSRKDHIANPTVAHPWRGKSKEVCTTCHHGTHTSNFKFEEYWPKIKHGQKAN